MHAVNAPSLPAQRCPLMLEMSGSENIPHCPCMAVCLIESSHDPLSSGYAYDSVPPGQAVMGCDRCGETQKASTLSKVDYWGPTLQLEKVACAKEEMFEGLNIGLHFEQECISPKMCNLFTSCILHILPMDFVGLDSKDPT